MFPLQGQSGQDPLETFRKGIVVGVTWSPNFLGVNANNSKMVKATDFKFGLYVSKDSPDMTP